MEKFVRSHSLLNNETRAIVETTVVRNRLHSVAIRTPVFACSHFSIATLLFPIAFDAMQIVRTKKSTMKHLINKKFSINQAALKAIYIYNTKRSADGELD